MMMMSKNHAMIFLKIRIVTSIIGCPTVALSSNGAACSASDAQ
jgi:hypothetical protein